MKKYPCPQCGKKGKIILDGKYAILDCSACALWKTAFHSNPETSLYAVIRQGDGKAGLESYYNKEIEKGVHGRDLIQPYIDGQPNQDFMDRYGDGILKGDKSQLDGKGKKQPKVIETHRTTVEQVIPNE